MNLGKENESRTFRKGLGELDDGLRSLCAILNGSGRAIVCFGVDGDGDVLGTDIADGTVEDIAKRIDDMIEPRIHPLIEELSDTGGRRYIRITAEGDDIPYSFDGRYFLRNGTVDEAVSNAVLRKMLVSPCADMISREESPLQELTFDTFFCFLSSRGIPAEMSARFFSDYRLVNEEGKFNLNAYLLSDDNTLSVRVVRFAGTDKSVMSTMTDYGSRCILVPVLEVLSYFESINTVKIDFSGAQRKEESLFDFPSFRAAWISACVYNDWTGGIAPAVYIFDDRIEIVSYGGLPFSLSKDDFFTGRRVPVNRSLLNVFRDTGLLKNCGGVPVVVARYGREAFSFKSGILKVTIPLSFERYDVEMRKSGESGPPRLTTGQRKVYDALAENGLLSLSEVAEITGLSVAGVKKICARLRECGLLKREGSRKTGRWITK